MKKFATFFLTTTLALGAFAQSDYPDFYLRGSDIPSDGVWGLNEDYKFRRSGIEYSLHVGQLNGEFKISNADWSINYGAPEQVTEITATTTLDGIFGGKNWKASNLNGVDIKFTYVDDTVAEVHFTVNGGGEVILDGISGTLPVLYINVYKDEAHSALDNEIISKDLDHKNYFSNAEYWLDLNGCEWIEELGGKSVGSKEAPLPLEIKARGNWTRRGYAKKPFKLKLGKKQDLLGLTPSKSKHYAIIAHADDQRAYLRNFTGFNIGHRIGLPWTPSQLPIEVVINGDYRGLYFLTESIRIGDGRIQIEELDDLATDPALVSGGYLVELDNYEEENQIRFTEKPSNNGDEIVRVTFDTPQEYSTIQYKFIEEQFNKINDLIGDNSDAVWSYLDLDDAARYYLANEIISHSEAYHGSTYLFRDRGENQKWHFSPMWDCGNAFNGDTHKYLYENGLYGNTWIHSFMRNAMFQEKVKETWKWFMANKFDGLYAEIDDICSHLEKAAVADRKRWKDAPRPDYPGATDVVDNSDMNSGKNYVKWHLGEKINWLKEQLGDYADGNYAEPARDTTPAAPLPSYIESGVEEISASEAEKAVYYSIDGIAAGSNASALQPGIYVKVAGDNAEKVVITK